MLCVDTFDYYCHRLAYLYTHGYIPEIVDHINGNRSDNRIENLRPSTKQLNAQNIKKANASNKLGLLGVHKGQRGRFEAKIMVSRKNIFLGEFVTPQLAHDAYLKAKRVMHAANTL